MRILSIDYGRKKIGVAIGDTESKLSEPLSVIRFETDEDAIRKIGEVAKIENTEKIVIGISEGEMAKETKKFGEMLVKELKIPIDFQDETLSTQEAQELSIDAHIKRKKRHELEDAYAAALVLQNFLDK